MSSTASGDTIRKRLNRNMEKYKSACSCGVDSKSALLSRRYRELSELLDNPKIYNRLSKMIFIKQGINLIEEEIDG